METNTKFEDVLEKDGELFFTNVGFSMYPLIKQREDILHIVKCNKYKKGDVVLYKDSKDQYIVHRILKYKNSMVILAGDHNPFKDNPINDSSIIGKLITITKRNGKVVNLDKDKKLRRFFYTNFFSIKAFMQKVVNFLRLRKVK